MSIQGEEYPKKNKLVYSESRDICILQITGYNILELGNLNQHLFPVLAAIIELVL